MRHLKVLHVKSCIVESRYIDRDYSADYVHFYAQTFRTHERHCKRLHFFSDDISTLLGPMSSQQVTVIQDFSRHHYCGFCVVRPLPNARIGRTVLKAEVRGRSDMEVKVTCRATFAANLFGVDLQVAGTSFLQQDARVGACAQVAIWAGLRHMHARYNSNWVSVADITRLAAPTTSSEAVSLPAGSDFLSSERMIRAISDVGFQPLCFREGPGMGAAILPYVESGIPVILGLRVGSGLGHAVTVIGRAFVKRDCPTSRAIDYVAAYIVHDDQAGPYMWLGMDEELSKRFSLTPEDMVTHSVDGELVEVNVREHAVFAVALMPTRVFSTAEAAEVTADARLDAVLRSIADVKKWLSQKGLDVNHRLLDELEAAHNARQIVLRTYLTSASGYRRHLVKGTASEALKNALSSIHLPHFAWVTEISTRDSYNHSSPAMRRIYGHTLLDATSTGRGGDGLLMLHIPGLVVTRDVDASPGGEEKTIPIANDSLYECREKGVLVNEAS